MQLRQQDATGALSEPRDLLERAGQAGRLADLDLFALELGLAGAQPWLGARTLLVGLSAMPAAALAELLRRVPAVARQSGVPPVQLALGIPAGQPRLRALSESLAQLARTGIQLALTDVPSARACRSATTLVRPVIVQAAGELTAGLASGRTWRELEQVIDSAREVGATLVAQQVQTPEQAQLLREMGVDHQQGDWPDRRPRTLLEGADDVGLRSAEDLSAQSLGDAGLLGAILQADDLQRRDRLSSALLRDHLERMPVRAEARDEADQRWT